MGPPPQPGFLRAVGAANGAQPPAAWHAAAPAAQPTQAQQPPVANNAGAGVELGPASGLVAENGAHAKSEPHAVQHEAQEAGGSMPQFDNLQAILQNAGAPAKPDEADEMLSLLQRIAQSKPAQT